MMESFSPLTRKLVALGLLIIVVLAALNLVVLPLTDRYDAREEAIGDARRQVGTYREVLARGPALKAQIEEIRQDANRRRVLLTAASPALAGARLEDMLKAVVQESGGALRSTRMQPQLGDGPERVRVTLDFTANPRALLLIVQKIESAVPWLITDNVQIRSGPFREGQPVEISARMDVDGFLWRDAP
jgi:general secretion pathway protein M